LGFPINPLAVRDESVGALAVGYGRCDRVVEQGALRDEGRRLFFGTSAIKASSNAESRRAI